MAAIRSQLTQSLAALQKAISSRSELELSCLGCAVNNARQATYPDDFSEGENHEYSHGTLGMGWGDCVAHRLCRCFLQEDLSNFDRVSSFERSRRGTFRCEYYLSPSFSSRVSECGLDHNRHGCVESKTSLNHPSEQAEAKPSNVCGVNASRCDSYQNF
jgi:hypothetical protein